MVKRWAVILATLGVLAPVGVWMLVPVAPTLHFDVDPRSLVDPATGRVMPATMMGPGAAAWWQAWAVLASGLAIAASLWAGARLQTWACGLAGLGMAAAAWHMTRSQPDALIGGAWIAAAALGLAAAHLTQLGVGRRWLTAGLAALLVPVLLDGLLYVLVDHPATVAQFEATRAEALASRGWEEGSAQAVMFERRLRFADVVGALGLSNVLGSVVAALTLLAGGVGVGAARRRRWGDAAAAGALTAAGLMTVWLTASKGAILVLPVAAALLGLAAWAVGRRRGGTLLAVAAGAMPVLAVAGVALRAALGAPETWEGERSLLFRWYYWVGGARVLGEAGPMGWLMGVGPARFKPMYAAVKPPLSPEEVVSAHNVVVDYVAMLGIGGLAWTALLLGWLVLAAWRLPRAQRRDPAAKRTGEADRAVVVASAALAVVVFGTEYAYAIPTLVIESALVWLAGAIGFIAAMAWLARRGDARWCGVGLMVAAAALLMHNQIEMTFHHGSAVAIAWMIVGAVGGLAATRPKRGGAMAFAIPAGLAVVGVLLAALHAAPTQAQQERLALAAAELQQGDYAGALRDLDAAGDAQPTDPVPLKWRTRLRMELAQRFEQQGRSRQAAAVLRDAAAIIEAVPSAYPDAATVWRYRSQVAQLRGDVPAAIAAAEAAVAAAPQSLPDRLALARLLWEAGQRNAAIEHYRAAQAISDASYLDPAKQLTPDEQREVAARLAD